MPTTPTTTIGALLACTVLTAACATRADIDTESHQMDVDAWREYRYGLLHEEGWLLLTGLHWLENGDNRVGAADDNDVVFRGAGVPSHIGTFAVSDSQVTMRVTPNVAVQREGSAIDEVVMEPGSHANATLLTLGSLNWHIVRRGDRYAVRVRDSLASSLLSFDGIPSYPLNPAWRLSARFEYYKPPKAINVPNILGTVNESESPGAVVFRVGLKRYRLDVLGNPADSAFWIQFGDATNGAETYGGGRYIWVDAPDENGRTIVDFNKSYNPPCVFTAYATCPLPPRQNKHDLRIEAGELKYSNH